MNSQQVTSLEQRAKIADNKIAAAQTKLSNMNAEIAAVISRRAQLTKEIEAETEQAKKDRKAELAELETAHRASIRAIDQDIRVLQTTKSQVEGDQIALEKKVRVLKDEFEHTKIMLARFKSDVATETESLKALEATVASLNAQVAQTSKQIAPLKQERSDLMAELTTLRSEKTEATTELSALISHVKVQETEGNRRLQLLASKEADMKRQLEGDRAYMTKLRDEMATRQVALDEREKVLMRREFKVGQNEQEIARNSGLLNL